MTNLQSIKRQYSKSMDDSMQPMKEQQVYKKIKVLGEGSMGRAYLVQSNVDDQFYVMKRIHIGHLSPQQQEGAKREAQLHSLVSHEHVIGFKQIYHTTKDKLCIIMEFAEGGDLDGYIGRREKNSIPQDQVLRHFIQICLGLRAIHEKKIVHRDLKGANIFLTKDGVIKIGDFGISRVIDQTVQASKSFVGTPYYLSPEMVEGKPYSKKADIWALGVILYHLCALKLPFEANSLPLLALKIVKGSFPPLTTGHYSPEIKSLILSMLQVNPKKRPSIQQILAKPILRKYLPKSEITYACTTLAPTKSRQNLHIKALNPKKKKIVLQKKLTEQQKKAKKEEALEKRNQIRSEMREDLKKKRQQIRKDHDETNKISPIKSSQKKEQKGKKQGNKRGRQDKKSMYSSQKAPKKQQMAIKPWKQKQISKQQLKIEMFVPEDRPKVEVIGEPSQIINDFQVQIYVSGKNIHQQEGQISNHQKKTDSEQEVDQQIQSQHFQQEQKQSQSPYQNNFKQLNEMLNQVKDAQEAVDGLANDFNKNLSLYEESDNFDGQGVFKEQKYLPQEQETMKYINNSENLEECRQILEEGLGQDLFIDAYRILNQHMNESEENRLKGKELQDYTFNREIIRTKLHFLSEENFNKYIVLLYTLIILEDEQMKKNFDD